ncbi:hypothetical protein SCLCIDRAFT_1224631 [Scleroderma citrinum Foug A]|uniref:Uncharacterized protein n=1 Tax=Scleroderma citrinum Foug A TaxID=1036808 RepID=A0A0C3D4H7_9AGAM|nr:hypothetical protein SCLCIDRAFT_1224631 [Scleroderma citrinum Foug A]
MNAVSKALVSAPESPEYAAWSIEHALNHTLRLRIATVGCPAARGDNVQPPGDHHPNRPGSLPCSPLVEEPNTSSM